MRTCLVMLAALLLPVSVAMAQDTQPGTLYEWKPPGGHRLTATNNDPQIILTGKVPARLPPGARIKVRMSVTAGQVVQIFWGAQFNEKDSLREPLYADGEMHDYEFLLPGATAVGQLRLDPTDAPGQIVIESLVIETGPGPEINLGAFYWDRVVPRLGRPERLCALLENTRTGIGAVPARRGSSGHAGTG